MNRMLPEDLQMTNERRFSRKHINGYIDTAIRENDESEAKVHRGAELLKAWLDTDHYKQKNARLEQLRQLNLEQMVRDIFIGIAYFQHQELFVSVTAQLATRLGFDDRRDSIQTIAEMVAILAGTDAFDLTKESAEASVMLQSRIPLPQALVDAIHRSLYLPPMVCQPKEVTTNYEAPYLTHNDCQILGKGNAHCGDICLDTINIQNQVALKLDTDFLSSVEEEPTFTLDTPEKQQGWSVFKQNSYAVYSMLVKQGNRFHFAHKVDKRGRKYAQGYHVTPQGSAFKKAMLELAHEEIIEGAPT